ncbi:MAG: sigma-70 family RNA polymerase sigma factor [Planctomycetes bacterium]|nr:sigma-70 family RNA polymerase sigma factor [Planctomycetota bacterium]
MDPPDDRQRAATEAMLPLVYDELRQIAQNYFRMQPPGFTLRPTDMVNEACLHLIQHSRVEWRSSEHFRAIATKKIWQIVVDHLRKRRAQKRGGVGARPSPTSPVVDDDGAAAAQAPAGDWKRVPLETVVVEWRDRAVDLLDLADALEALAAESRRLSDVVKLHWFGGLPYADVARFLDVSLSTVEKDFRYALAWLNRRLGGDRDHVD